MSVRLSAGPDGRFGFNVRGGGNGTPVLVSRVAPRTRVHLQEGDQVGIMSHFLFISWELSITRYALV